MNGQTDSHISYRGPHPLTIPAKFSFSWLNGFRKDLHMNYCENKAQFAYSVKIVQILNFIKKKQKKPHMFNISISCSNSSC